MNHLVIKAQFAYLSVIFLFITLLLITPEVNSTFASNNEEVRRDAIISNIETYLRNIKSVAINFRQHDTKNKDITIKGVLIIDKPYKFRVNYFQPYPLTIVGNKNYVSVYDDEMETLSRMNAKDNVFNFLLLDQIDFDNQFKVLETSRTRDYDEITLIHLDSGKISNISFNRDTGNIEKMVIQEDDQTISLEFGSTTRVSKISKNLFILQDPEVFGKPQYFDEKNLKKQYQEEK